MMSVRRARGHRHDRTRRALGAAAVAICAIAIAACHDTREPRFLDLACKEEGRCECIVHIDCAFGEACLDGQCVTLAPELDVVTPDTTAPDTGAPGDATATDATALPGELGWPCESNSDCNAGLCVLLDGGERVCSRRCITECPDGWSCRGVESPGGTVDFFCLPDRERLCEPCVNDLSCRGEDNLCLRLGDTLHCGEACDAGACPAGYTCSEITSVDGVGAAQCVPESGVCQCTSDSVGSQVPCRVENEHGTCFGVQPCLEGPTLGECTARVPAAEICDGVDNDCNGFVDDLVPVTDCTRDNEHGSCVGDLVCLQGIGEVCTASIPEPERCDSLDNDCDGDVDEAFRDAEGRYDRFDHCGGCNVSCEGRFPNADEVVCDATGEAPRCRVVSCLPGFIPSGDEACVRPPDLLCRPCVTDAACGGPGDRCLAFDPTDTRSFCARDCAPGNAYGAGCPEGYTCTELTVAGAEVSQCLPDNLSCDCGPANAGQTRPCTVANAFGTCFGLATCEPDLGWSGCTARTPAAELCNGVDDDCDGVIDDGLGGGACDRENAFGVCVGVERCQPETGEISCVGPDAAEDVCDGRDNDCDGDTDEAFAVNVRDDGGQLVELVYALSDAHCGGCGIPCAPVAPATETECALGPNGVFCRVVECEAGFYPFNGRACLPVPSGNLCLPCSEDSDCLGPDDRCLDDYEGGAGCGRDCGVGSIYSTGSPGEPGYCDGVEGERGCCPAGFTCAGGQCRRDSGACDCDVDGKIRSCAVSNEHGTCGGVSTCVTTGPGAGWQPCSAQAPGPEVCDGIDNDCDGLVDQADPSVDVSGLGGYPTCQNVSEACPGDWACARVDGAFAWTCSARAPTSETCSGLDDDCDGVVDNGFVDAEGRYTTIAHCGGCGLDCAEAIANLRREGGAVAPGAVTCAVDGETPRCVPVACEPGFIPFPSDAPRFCLPLAARSCQPCSADEDCGFAGDRCVEVGTDDGRYCAQRCGADAPYPGCTGVAGEQGCCPDGFTCAAEGAERLCRPVSDSCQCSEDNAGLSRVCSAEGNGGATTCFGTSSCALDAGAWQWGACDLSANVEVCDGLDNDCNGLTDEAFLIDGAYATDSHCGQCGRNCAIAFSASEQHVFGVCDAGVAGGPACVIGGCLVTDVGSGEGCRFDADCGGGATCRANLGQCGQGCTSDAACGGGRCVGGICAAACGGDAACVDAYGPTSRCEAGACVTTYQWVDLDGAQGNGCECPAAVGLERDDPDILDFVPLPGVLYADSDCDGVDGDVETALFVDSAAFAGDGSLEAPFPTVGEAIAAWGPQTSHILVATGVYAERIALTDGVKVFGGYSQDFSQRDIVLFPTVIAGPSDVGPGPALPATVHASGIVSETILAGFTVVGYDVVGGNEASYALYVADAPALRVVNNAIVGGRGGAGAPGANGAVGQNGGAGGDGLPSRECANAGCQNGSETQAGGASGTNAACPAAGGCVGMEADTDETPQVKDAPAPGCSYGRGGDRGRYRSSGPEFCKYDFTPDGNQTGTSGTGGGPGGSGAGGSGCAGAAGAVVGGVWVPGAGAGGGGGTAGTGGNGGSAGGWVRNDKTGACTIPAPGANFGDVGGSGGGGGAGGCGGAGGAAGQSGGASFAVFVASGGAPELVHNTVARGRGGRGGNGGNGGTGGRGGEGGRGGTAGWPAWGAGVGGNGGRGGDGGDGAGGGGGCGGPSWAIAGVGIPAAAYTSANAFAVPDAVATGGDGGRGGLSPAEGAAGTPGAAGVSANVRVF